MTKWSKALAVVAIGVAAGLLAPGSANAATHHAKPVKSVKQVTVADPSGGLGVVSTNSSLTWEG
ncbi:exported hypothetical protein [Nostocoides japonicum T1-X7]|uniref:Uncharacterized protein n=1 Tax=Nostocoides japonicum T1-X7 TaxID=1194083 RepID=A0A077M6G9_9MICO|nr:hypothetical protein [Tetrasphaera japonica]CCH79754.1 exported hypothetical protein [Tetrasphaera japonica T1-X7]